MSDPGPLLGRRSGWSLSLFAGLFATLVWAVCFHFPVLWRVTGIGEENRPFFDLYGLLASIERAQAGFDSFQLNPLDPYQRPNLYAKWWLLAGRFGVTRADTLWLGAGCVGAMLLTALVLLKPATRREMISLILVLISPALLMAVNRANNDLVIFVLVSGAFLLLRDQRAAPRALGVVLLAISAVLKYYPLATLVVLLQARSRRELLGWFALYAGVLLLAWPALSEALVSASRFKPRTEWVYAFGASTLWRNFHWENPLLWTIPLLLLLVGSAWAARRDPSSSSSPAPAEHPGEPEFFTGSAFIIGGFVLGGSYAYKLIFALWLLPWLWRAVLPPAQARWRQTTLRLLLGVLWLEGVGALAANLGESAVPVRFVMGFLYVVLTGEQLLTWWLVACLLRWFFIHVAQRVRFLLTTDRVPAAAGT